ncbi:ADP-ribosylglycohydrolase family protein [Falsirhodobacter xinxiangensis]|uniref:ADP-ribosylglycohydrolase family protein n=1 Tax=Falsirhodobacter xinxiangensis TaxID=2530049 RepID=UPI001FE7B56E|nr:ADP-ribosylglycohydrolase family protein [Rhodobacter xinxiangensis]
MTRHSRCITREGNATQHLEHIRACLFGGAIGDAWGAEIEFWSLGRIRRQFPDGITEMPAHDGRVGRITDDTQMTLFTAEGLIRAVVRAQSRGICAPKGVVHHALLRWYRTQGGTPSTQICDVGRLRMRGCASAALPVTPVCRRSAMPRISVKPPAMTARVAGRSCGPRHVH